MKPIIIALFATVLLYSAKLPAQENNAFLKVMTYNILNGFDRGKNTLREEELTSWVNLQRPDVLALQELCGFTQEKLESLAKKWGHSYALILKTDGYPVGLTSNNPIELKERLLEEMWHGMLHVKTYGIDFFVVHLSPSDLAFRKKEARILLDRINQLSVENDQYIVLGDFNAHSPFDGEFDRKYPYQLQRSRKRDAASKTHKNLQNNEFDYGVVSTFLSIPLIDVCQRYVPLDQRTTAPSPINVGKWLTAGDMKKTKHRIDFILVSPGLGARCTNAKIFNGEETGFLSDHYPVQAVFDFK